MVRVMQIFLSIGLIIVVYVMYNAPIWKSNNRITPPGKEIDNKAIIEDQLIKGYDNREVAVKMNQGGYDVPKKTYENKK